MYRATIVKQSRADLQRSLNEKPVFRENYIKGPG